MFVLLTVSVRLGEPANPPLFVFPHLGIGLPDVGLSKRHFVPTHLFEAQLAGRFPHCPCFPEPTLGLNGWTGWWPWFWVDRTAWMNLGDNGLGRGVSAFTSVTSPVALRHVWWTVACWLDFAGALKLQRDTSCGMFMWVALDSWLGMSGMLALVSLVAFRTVEAFWAGFWLLTHGKITAQKSFGWQTVSDTWLSPLCGYHVIYV